MNRKIICFYLPQFYEFEENNRWWGTGFTEWTNVKKSAPLFHGHYQPTVPLNEYYYRLDEKKTFEWQIELAKKYHVYGFCFYHYYFGNGKYLMEKPLDMFLKGKDLDIHFCLCWANHTWSRTWTGEEKDILMAVTYDDEAGLRKYFDYLKEFFLDKRYILIDNKPVYVIYVPEQIPQLTKMKALFNEWAKEIGFDGIVFISQNTEVALNRDEYRDSIDYSIYYEPNFSLREFRDLIDGNHFLKAFRKYPRMTTRRITNRISRKWLKKKNKINTLDIIDYKCIWKKILKRNYPEEYWPGGFVKVDTTPRKGSNGLVTMGATPERFRRYLSKLIAKCSHSPFVFLMAWNEWGEGAYLEPDEKYRFQYLEALRDAVEQNQTV